MTTLEINIIENESLVLDVLKAFEQRHLISVNRKNSLTTIGEKLSEMEYEEMLNEARNSKSYSLTDAKKYLNL